MPDALTVELFAADTINATGPFSVAAVEVIIANAGGGLEVENEAGRARTLHRFTVTDATHVGYGGRWALSRDDASSVLALACSLSNPRVLFSKSVPAWATEPQVRRGAPEPPTVSVETIDGSVIVRVPTLELRLELHQPTIVVGVRVELDEGRVLDSARRLLGFRLFDRTGRSVRDGNVLDAIDAYVRAGECTERVSCFRELWTALEKAVNADRGHRELRGTDLDAAAATMTSLTEDRARELREASNRLKHIAKDAKEAAGLSSVTDSLGPLTRDVKSAADDAVLKRL
jgi:hypothetical protein